jgi:hypothetical protein
MAQTWAFGTSSVKDQSATGGTSMVINKPTSTADGELLLGFIMTDAANTITAPSGWTQFTGSPQSSAGSLKMAAYWKVAASEGASWSWSVGAGGNLWVGCVGRWTGLTATPHDVSNGTVQTTAATINAPTVTTTAADDLVARAVSTWNAATVTFASGTSRISTGSNGDLMKVYDQNQAAAGATGTNTATANNINEMAAFTGSFLQSGVATDPFPAGRVPAFRAVVRRIA